MNIEAVLCASLSVSYGDGPRVLDQFALSINPGEIVALVGESGSGKSTLALALLRLLDEKKARMSGSIVLNGRDLMPLKEREMRSLRGNRLSLVLQSAGTALNPLLRIGTHFRETWKAHRKQGSSEFKHAAEVLLERVCLPSSEEFLRRYPREISIGQAQRVLIALALLHKPDLLIADEPTSALDAITHAEILRLFRDLNRDLGLAILLISHDLLSVASICSKLAILRHGTIVESGAPATIFESPAHPYTRKLIAALPPHPLASHRYGPDTGADMRLIEVT
jgi:ABC-type dipeptide/oligopeptide/nickel transport system ATPase component